MLGDIGAMVPFILFIFIGYFIVLLSAFNLIFFSLCLFSIKVLNMTERIAKTNLLLQRKDSSAYQILVTTNHRGGLQLHVLLKASQKPMTDHCWKQRQD